MKYTTFEALELECESLRQQLADSQKRAVMLCEFLKEVAKGTSDHTTTDVIDEYLATTADLNSLILCRAEEVGYYLKCDEFFDNGYSSKQLNEQWKPVFSAWEPK